MFLFWKIWFHYSKKKLIKNYKPEEDLGRLAEEEKKKLENLIDDGKTKTRKGGAEQRDSRTAATDSSSVGFRKPKERELLQKTNVDSVRKNRSGIRKILRRGRRR